MMTCHECREFLEPQEKKGDLISLMTSQTLPGLAVALRLQIDLN